MTTSVSILVGDSITSTYIEHVSGGHILFMLALFLLLWCLIGRCKHQDLQHRASINCPSQLNGNTDNVKANTPDRPKTKLNSMFIKLRQDLLVENEELKAHVLLLTREKDTCTKELREERDKSLISLGKLEEKAAEQERQVLALTIELSEQDEKINWYENCWKKTERDLQDAKLELERTHKELNVIQRKQEQIISKLEQTNQMLEVTKMKLDESNDRLNKQRQLTSSLRETLKQNKAKLMKEKGENGALKVELQARVGEYEEKLKQIINGYNARMRLTLKETYALSNNLSVKEQELEEMHKKVIECRNALKQAMNEREDMITGHKHLLARFEKSFKELDECAEKLKIN